MSKIPPLNVQFELAMLWRTLSVLKSIDVPSVILFYQKLIPNLKIMPQLSLSAYWGNNSLVDMHSGSGDIGLDGMREGKSSEVNIATSLLNIAELDYLRHEETIDSNHDPLQVMQNLYSTAAMFILHNLSSSTFGRDVLLSACLNMAVKSGRISLLLHFVLMVLSLHESYHEIDIDTDCIQDIVGFIQAMESNRQSYLKEEEEEEVKQPINTKSNNNKNSKLPFHKSSTALSSTSPPPLRSSSASSPEALHDDILTVQEDPLSSIKSTSSSTTAAVDFVDHIHARNGRFSRANPGIMKSNGILLSFGKADHGNN